MAPGLVAWHLTGDGTVHNKVPPPLITDRPGRPSFQTPAELFCGMSRMQALELERRALILASSTACAMDFDLEHAEQPMKKALVLAWHDNWLSEHSRMRASLGKFTGQQMQMVSRYIDILQHMFSEYQ